MTINELINELKGKEVTCKKLGEICSIEKGEQLNKSLLAKDGNNSAYPYPVYNGGTYPSGYWKNFNVPDNTIIISQGGCSAGYVNWIKEKFWAGAHCFYLKNSQIDYRYLYFYLKFNQDKLYEMQEGAGIPGLSKQNLYNLDIYFPSLPYQQQIVKILDDFTELEAELEARKKQYDYWLNYLLIPTTWRKLNSNQLIKSKKISEIATTQRGRIIAKNILVDYDNSNFPVYSSKTLNNGILGYLNSYDFNGNYISWTTDGENAGDVFYHSDEKFNITNVCGLIKLNSKEINLKFLYYYLKINLKKYVNRLNPIPKMMSNVLENIKIDFPSISVQQLIVSILTPLDSLSQNPQDGIPAEIKLRKEQYQYYLKQLLNFNI